MWFWRIYWCLIFYFKPYKNNSFSNKRGRRRKATSFPDIKLHCSFILVLSVWAEFFPLPFYSTTIIVVDLLDLNKWKGGLNTLDPAFIKQCPSSLIDRDEKTPGAWISREVVAILGSHMNKYWHFHQGSPKPGTKWEAQTYKWVDPGRKPALRWVRS